MPAKTKVCSSCKKEKSVSEFVKHSSKKDGLCPHCKTCWSEMSKKKREQYKEKNKNRDPYDGTIKTCPECGESMPRTREFWKIDPCSPDGLQTYCSSCISLKKIKFDAKKRGEILNFPTSFTGKEARELKKKQDYKCYVCGKEEDGRSLDLDHNHNTGRIRGYACGKCNTNILSGLDATIKLFPSTTKTFREDPILYQILWHPPAEYLYDPL